jgi:hypothetical protein
MMEASWRLEQAHQARRVNKCAGHDDFSGSRSGSPVAVRAGSLPRGDIEQSGRWSGDACVVAQPISLGWPTRFFAIDYDDFRHILKTDNRHLAVRKGDTENIHIQTWGGHSLHAVTTTAGTLDAFAWGALQTGR